MKVYLKKEQFELLNNYCYISLDTVGLLQSNNKVFIDDSFHYFENLLDKVSDLLTEKGMKNNKELNEFGYQIEEIIDILSKELYN